MKTDVHIVGGGPSGSIASMSLIDNGYSPLISEEHKVSGLPVHCSGLISKSGLNSLSRFIDYRKLIENNFNGAVIHFSTIKLNIERKKDVAYQINRSEFDKTLISNAESKGVKINYNDKISSVSSLKSNFIIGADGANSQIAKMFNFPKIKKFVGTAQIKIPYNSIDSHKVQLFYSNDLFPGFFGWIIPTNKDYAEIGCGVVLPKNARNSLELFMKKLNLSLFLSNPSFSSMVDYSIIPIRTREKTALSIGDKKIILVGDAAGHVKATTGGGIVFGGNCSKLVGRNMSNPYNYEREWKRKFGFDLKVHQLIQSFFEGRSESDFKNIGNFLNSMNIPKYLSERGNMDSPSKMISFDFLIYFIDSLFK